MASTAITLSKPKTSALASRKRSASKAGFDTPCGKKRVIAKPAEKNRCARSLAAGKKSALTTPVGDDTKVLAKPKASGEPPVWAQCRQALCETLPYYHCFQGSAYTRDGFVYGVLLDEDRGAGSGAYCDQEVIISRIGGGSTTDSEGNVTKESEIMAANYLAAFSSNLERGIPVIIIFVFYVTNIWATKVGTEIVRQIRYEKEFSANKSWWSPIGSPAPSLSRDYSQKANVQTCSTCATSHTQVYSSHWMCLNDQCKEFAHLLSLPALNPAFLAERSDNTGKPKAPFLIIPALPKQDLNRPFDSYHLARGIVCPHCKTCTSRASWYGYRCNTEGCGFIHTMPHISVSQAYFNGRLQHEAIGHALPVDKCIFPVVERSSLCEGDFRTTIFDLMPGNFVVHAQGNMYANAAARGPNEIFLALQAAQGIPLERRVKDLSRNSQRELTNHFAANFGTPYSYSAKASHLSIAFSDAPDPIMAALGRLIWTAKRVLPDGALAEMLNELLLVGYMNDNSMGWHDDGEKGLGITVATLSLGGSAMMHFRMKKKYYNPAALANTELRINKYDPKRKVPVGSKLWEKRKALNEKFGKIPTDEWEKAKREVFAEYAKVKTLTKKLLEVELKHGDYLIMHGGEIQKYYEHEVQSKASLRFGLTARYIDPIAHNIPEEEHHKGVFELGENDIHD